MFLHADDLKEEVKETALHQKYKDGGGGGIAVLKADPLLQLSL